MTISSLSAYQAARSKRIEPLLLTSSSVPAAAPETAVPSAAADRIPFPPHRHAPCNPSRSVQNPCSPPILRCSRHPVPAAPVNATDRNRRYLRCADSCPDFAGAHRLRAAYPAAQPPARRRRSGASRSSARCPPRLRKSRCNPPRRGN